MGQYASPMSSRSANSAKWSPKSSQSGMSPVQETQDADYFLSPGWDFPMTQAPRRV